MFPLLTSLLLSAHAAPGAEGTGPSIVVDLEWRGMALGGHLSHGPGFGVAVGVLNDHLRLGLSGFARPGPMNPATFTLEPDAPYKGQDRIALRSDGSLLGPSLAVGANLSPTLRLDAVGMVGYGGFGFYLVGDDRKTPDGRLPSAWENELMDERDSSLGLGMDVGPRVTWAAGEHVRPYVAARYTTVFGYDAFMRDSYDGLSVAVGLTVGRIP